MRLARRQSEVAQYADYKRTHNFIDAGIKEYSD